MSIHTITSNVGKSPVTFETGKMGRLADGAVTVRSGDTMVMVTAVSATKVKDGQDWFPLSVEYKEKASAAGVFPGGYFKREGRPTEKEILTCRMTDRPLRPLFPKGYLYETQIIALLLSADGINDSDILSMNGASAALALSDIPFAGPIGAVRVGRVDGEFVVNPTFEEREVSDLDLVYVGNEKDVIMIEGAAEELPDEDFKKSLRFAQEQVQILIASQAELVKLCGKETREYDLMLPKEELLEVAYEVAGDKIEDAIYKPSKVERGKAVGALRKELEEKIKSQDPDATDFDIDQAFDYLQKKAFRVSIMEKGVRADGRKIGDLRQLVGEVDLIPKVHGSALFARGETQALAIATLAPADERLYMDNYAGGEDSKNFFLHYNFPPFSVGETGRFGGQNRREIGHGALAERSIAPVLPDAEDFPYTMRISSEVMESNGSTSMATVCSGSMALMAAGVPLKAPVAGISCGLVTEFEGEEMKDHKLILDIIGSEDFFGDMDFKLCGTESGVTGFQLDLKLPGVSLDILEAAVDVTKQGRLDVLDYMNSIISEANGLSENAPRIETMKIDPSKIGELIGPGGKNIRSLQADSGAEISVSDDGTVQIYAAKPESLNRAKELLDRMFADIEIGKEYTGKIVSTTKFGAFMQVLPGKDGLIHISELSHQRVNDTEDVVKVGEEVTAKCIGVDEKGRVKMSIKALGGGGGGGNSKPRRERAPKKDDTPPADEEVVEFTLG